MPTLINLKQGVLKKKSTNFSAKAPEKKRGRKKKEVVPSV
jgi:hypothetical protein